MSCVSQDVGWYRVDNSELRSSAEAVGYRKSKDDSDKDDDLPGVLYNSLVQGELHNGWLRVSVQGLQATSRQ